MDLCFPPLLRTLVRGAVSSLAATLALAPLALAGQIIVVDVGGTADYVNIQDAVAASQSGDLILVLAGVYPGFTVDNKNVHISAVDGALVKLNSGVEVLNTTPDTIVTLRGLFSTGGSTGSAQEGLKVNSCQGTVRLDDCDFRSFRALSQTPSAVLVEQSAAVTFTGGSVRGADATPGGTGLTATASNIAVFRTTIRGGSSESVGGAGALLLGSSGQFFLTDGWVRGGWGHNGVCPEFGNEIYAGDGGDGLVNEGWDAWAQNSTVAGGSGGTPDDSFYWCSPVDGTDGQDILGPLTILPGNGREFEAPATTPSSSNFVSMTFRGRPGDSVYLQASLGGGFELGPRHDGPLLLQTPFLGILGSTTGAASQLGGGIPLGLQTSFLGTIGFSHELTVLVPVLPIAANAPVTTVQLQGMLRDTGGTVWMTDPRTLSLVPNM